MSRWRRWLLPMLLSLAIIAVPMQGTALAGPVVSDIPTLSISVDPAAFAAVNADIEHDTIAPIDVEVTDPRNGANNLSVRGMTTEIKGRGNFTWTLPYKKKPYQIKFADGNSQNMLGMGAARAWVLLANTVDASLMRNKVALDLAEEFGMPFTTESRWVDLVINGQSWGNYLLTEKVEVKKTRVDLRHSQGVLVEQDYNYGTGDPIYHRTPRGKSYFVLKDAKSGNPDTAAQLLLPEFANTKLGWDEFVTKIDALDLLLADPNANWEAITQLIDVDSFVKMFYLYEFTENQELARSSVHFYRDGPSDKIHAGPVWDFDVAMGNFDDSLIGRGGNPEVDYVANVVAWRPDGLGNDWFPQLLKSSGFTARARAMYPTLRPRIDDVPGKILEYRAYLERSAPANFSRWTGILGNKTLLPYGTRSYASTWGGEVDRLLSWVVRRVNYLNLKYAGTTGNATACSAEAAVGTHTTAGAFNAVNPCRMLDTRFANGVPTTAAVPANGEVRLKVTGRGGVPSTASAVALNVTVTAPQQAGFLTVYPSGTPFPPVSNLNYLAGQTVPNQVMVAAGSDGFITLRNTSAGTVHVVADLLGYFAAGSATVGGSFQGIEPTRLLDTREAAGPTAGAPLTHDHEVTLQVAGSHDRAAGEPLVIPQDASAVVLNVTAANPTAAGHITVYPTGGARPVVSNLNFVAAQGPVPNLVTVKLGEGGAVNLYANAGGDPGPGAVHVIADVFGYYMGGEATQPGTFVPLSPRRILDSRDGTGMVAKLGITTLARRINNYETIALDAVTALGGPTSGGVAAVVMNVTVTNPTGLGHLTIHPDGTARPLVSSLNFVTSQTVPNLVTVRTGANGKVDLYPFSAGQTDLIADLAGYYRK